MTDSKLMKTLCRWIACYYLKKPDQAEIIHIKHPRISDIFPSLMNEVCYRRRFSRTYKLIGLNIELTSRCNLSCSHCPRSGISRDHKNDMDFDTFKMIIDGAPDVRTLLPFQWGEPLLSPMIYDCISYASSRGIRVMVTTNGTLLDEKASKNLIESGLERLTISFEGDKNSQKSIRGTDPDQVIANAVNFKRIRDKLGLNCALDVSMVVDEKTEPMMTEFKKIFNEVGDRLQFIPRFIKSKRVKPCRELWRGVLVVLSNGDVTICCADNTGKAVIGNVNDRPLTQMLNSTQMQKLRQSHKLRSFTGICKECGEYRSESVSPRFS